MDERGAQRFYGKYRGSVVNNADPERRGRLLLKVPAVQGELETTWAEACLPLSGSAGLGMGMYWVPPNGAAVWVEFEAGDPDHPIWSGCMFDSGADVPAPALQEGGEPDSRWVMQTRGRTCFVLSDVASEGITLRAASGAELTINAAGITLSTGQGATIELARGKVSVNGSALEVE